MAVDNKNVIDVVSIDLNGNAVLTISDHLEWDSKNEHLLVLQEKINSYLAALESGELYKKYPDAINRKLIILVVTLYEPSTVGQMFLNRVKSSLEELGYAFEFRTLGKSENSV